MNFEENERLPPMDMDAEAALLGCVLIDGSCLPELQSVIGSDDFYRQGHKLIWDASVAVQENNKKPDSITIRAEMRKEGTYEQAGGMEYLNKLLGEVPSSANFMAYASTVKRFAELRNLVNCGETLSREAHAGTDPDELKARAVNLLSTDSSGNSSWEEIEAVADRYMKRGPAKPGFNVGLRDLQYSTGGLYEGLNVIAGMPGAGKTTLACQLVNRAILCNHKVSIVSMDQQREDLFGVMWCNMAGLQEEELTKDGLDDYTKLVNAQCRFYKGKFDLSRIVGALRINASLGYNWVLVDYLGLINVAGSDSQHAAAEQAAKTLKTLAHEIGLTILLVVSFVKPKDGAAVGMSQVRGTMEVSHAPEQMWILEPGKGMNDPVTCHIVKSRKRGKGRVMMDLRGATRRFCDVGGNADDFPLPPRVKLVKPSSEEKVPF